MTYKQESIVPESKTFKPITKNKKKSKMLTREEEESKIFYLDMYTMRQKPYSNQTLEDMAVELLNWAKDTKDVVSLYEFFILKGIAKQTFSNFVKRCPKLKKAKDFAIMIFGMRREKGALLKNLDFNTMKHMQGRYDPEWKEREEYFLDQKKQVADKQQSSSTINCSMPSVDQFQKESDERREKTDSK